MESNHKSIVVLRCKLLVVGESFASFPFNDLILRFRGCLRG